MGNRVTGVAGYSLSLRVLKLADSVPGRAPALDVLLLANVLPLAVYLAGLPYTIVALSYVAGNAVWLALLFKAGSSVDAAEGPALAWIPSLVMTAGALSWTWVSERAGTIGGGFGWDGRQYA